MAVEMVFLLGSAIFTARAVGQDAVANAWLEQVLQ